ncbi:MAG: hypothetical protein L6Q83_09310, partial [Gammaproteobacteria bacterium]|nr:hypothetical protein [Gammaproteobacteria bacterium]
MTILKRVVSFLRTAWLALGTAFVILLMMEVVFAAFFTADGGSMWSDPQRGDSRASADSYQGEPWAKDLYEEFVRSAAVDWFPYVYFRRQRFDGQYINIDANGIRRTANNTLAASTPKRLFMFGGSTVWGTGVRDEFTIPSL